MLACLRVEFDHIASAAWQAVFCDNRVRQESQKMFAT